VRGVEVWVRDHDGGEAAFGGDLMSGFRYSVEIFLGSGCVFEIKFGNVTYKIDGLLIDERDKIPDDIAFRRLEQDRSFTNPALYC
jgi:hypothetical protein